MIKWIIYITISFFLDGILSNITNTSMINPSYFRTLYTIIALVVSYSYFDNQKKYLYLLLIFGFLFDIVYTNTILLNIIIFLLIYILLRFIDNFVPNNIFMINIKALIAVFMYHIISYLFLMLADKYYPPKLLGIIIVRSIVMTLIYTSTSYLLFKRIYLNKYDKFVK